MKFMTAVMATCLFTVVNAANAETVDANIFGISPSMTPESFKVFVSENLADFRGGWACASMKNTHSCYSNASDITVLDETDDSLSLIVTEDMQILVASCGVFDACEGFGMDALTPAISNGDINFPTENAKMLQSSPNIIVGYENGAFMIDVSQGYVKMTAGR